MMKRLFVLLLCVLMLSSMLMASAMAYTYTPSPYDSREITRKWFGGHGMGGGGVILMQELRHANLRLGGY